MTRADPAAGAPWLDAYWSPDGAQALVLKDRREIRYTPPPETSQRVPLGTSLVVASLWLEDLDTNREERLFEAVLSAAWSPAGDRVAVVLPDGDAINGVLIILDLATRTWTTLDTVDGLGSRFAVIWPATGRVLAARAGKVLAFDPTGQQPSQPTGFYSGSWVAMNGTIPTYYRKRAQPLDLNIAPDGLRMTYSTTIWLPPPYRPNLSATATRLWIAEIEQTSPPIWVTNQANRGDVIWSPDSSAFVVSTLHALDSLTVDAWLPRTFELWAIDANGKHAQRLAQNDSYSIPYRPVWSPDGSMVLYDFTGSPDAAQRPGLRIANTRTGEEVPLDWSIDTTSLGQLRGWWWAPSGNRIVVTFVQDSSMSGRWVIQHTVWLQIEPAPG